MMTAASVAYARQGVSRGPGRGQVDAGRAELRAALATCRGYFLHAALFSLAINLLYLASPIYMMQIYDRVLPSASIVTLVMLTIVLIVAIAVQGVLDAIRASVLARAGIRLDRLLSARLVAATIEASVPKGGLGDLHPLKDLDTLRHALTGAGMHAAFDLPWTPVYILIIAGLHPALALFALLSAVTLAGLAILNERLLKRPLDEANDAAEASHDALAMCRRNAEAVQAMGLLPGFLAHWIGVRNLALSRQQAASDRAAVMLAMIKGLRLCMQSGILGLGAYLVVERSTSVGAIFAASILLGRALQPMEQIVGTWRLVVAARAAFRRLSALLEAAPPPEPAVMLPRPVGHLAVEDLLYRPRPNARVLLHGLSFRLGPGEVCSIVGPSGAGKSTLARHLVGLVPPTAGVVRLDGADIAGYPRDGLGRHIGYLPQDIELFADTIAANIGRFDATRTDAIVAAARMAGVHDLVLRLPQGYQTPIGEGGAMLSGGTRQRIALARAVYGNPSLVVLDEPSSNLDTEGDAALLACIGHLKRRGATVLVISHKPAAIGVADKLLVIKDGTLAAFGPRRDVLRTALNGRPMHIVPDTKGDQQSFRPSREEAAP